MKSAIEMMKDDAKEWKLRTSVLWKNGVSEAHNNRRERVVARRKKVSAMLADGKTVPEIARYLDISETTIFTDRKAIESESANE